MSQASREVVHGSEEQSWGSVCFEDLRLKKNALFIQPARSDF